MNVTGVKAARVKSMRRANHDTIVKRLRRARSTLLTKGTPHIAPSHLQSRAKLHARASWTSPAIDRVMLRGINHVANHVSSRVANPTRRNNRLPVIHRVSHRVIHRVSHRVLPRTESRMHIRTASRLHIHRTAMRAPRADQTIVVRTATTRRLIAPVKAVLRRSPQSAAVDAVSGLADHAAADPRAHFQKGTRVPSYPACAWVRRNTAFFRIV